VFAQIVPLALGIAASPFPIVPAILLLFTQRPRASAGAFLAGWVVGILAACGVFAVLASVIELNEETPTWVSWTKIALGALLVVAGVQQWRKRKAQSDPAWMQALDDATPRSALRLGLLLSAANPKVLLLAAGGGLAIGAAALPAGQAVAAVATFTAIASCTVALPWVLFTLRGERVLVPLGRARDWLRAHNAVVMAAVLSALGVLLVIEGVSGL
jgi:threonine/homoserine/homoserine lactone efflux protein